ncbi:unnamed protein product [Effrenium voratum]|uniref:Rhodanese domain-containing protein n=1 Tax=Effrenium voratum TaxID=2562239 RepID=A0AA36NG68_9DINO|nr:unnamed protein product [Effrenium voratum]CAJ1411545.1 unnamed protein product [Effrenium voratum]CAJ1418328.1 unnamed protein product [Effrenium voratum]
MREDWRWRGTSKPSEIWSCCGLTKAEVERYGRQIVLPSLGPEGQRQLLQGSVLIVGAGGLGCPVALYLAAAGVGRLGIADADTVAVSNLHRQIGHSCGGAKAKARKAESLARACAALNDAVRLEPHPVRLSELQAAARLMAGYDLVVDCTDAPPSRYLLNDAALSASRPLVAASAVGLSGQLVIYNFEGGPCLRCVFPVLVSPADAEPVASCEENGVLGPIVGTVGSLAALEVIKVLAKGSKLHNACLRGKMLLFEPMSTLQPCRSVRIHRQPTCKGCGGAQDAPMPPGCAVQLEDESVGISPDGLRERLAAGRPTLLLDVRQPAHFVVTSLRGAVNWPLTQMLQQSREERGARMNSTLEEHGLPETIVCLCRRGVDSLTATMLLRDASIPALNLSGGLQALALAEPEPPALT